VLVLVFRLPASRIEHEDEHEHDNEDD
jgi:hypothetical protein